MVSHTFFRLTFRLSHICYWSFENYVDKFWNTFWSPTYLTFHWQTLTFFRLCTYLPTSPCQRSLWTTPYVTGMLTLSHNQNPRSIFINQFLLRSLKFEKPLKFSTYHFFSSFFYDEILKIHYFFFNPAQVGIWS